MRFNRREFLRTVAVIAAGWVALLFLLSRWHRSSKPQPAATEPVLVHYPGYEDVEEQTSPNLGFRKYWFRLNEDYPSRSVYYFYRNLLEPEGWEALSQHEPQWVRRATEKEVRDLFQAIWVSPDRLFQIELEMMSEVKLVTEGDTVLSEEREPGIQVFVTLRRTLHPGIMLQPRPPGGESGLIEADR